MPWETRPRREETGEMIPETRIVKLTGGIAPPTQVKYIESRIQTILDQIKDQALLLKNELGITVELTIKDLLEEVANKFQITKGLTDVYAFVETLDSEYVYLYIEDYDYDVAYITNKLPANKKITI